MGVIRRMPLPPVSPEVREALDRLEEDLQVALGKAFEAGVPEGLVHAMLSMAQFEVLFSMCGGQIDDG